MFDYSQLILIKFIIYSNHKLFVELVRKLVSKYFVVIINRLFALNNLISKLDTYYYYWDIKDQCKFKSCLFQPKKQFLKPRRKFGWSKTRVKPESNLSPELVTGELWTYIPVKITFYNALGVNENILSVHKAARVPIKTETDTIPWHTINRSQV